MVALALATLTVSAQPDAGTFTIQPTIGVNSANLTGDFPVVNGVTGNTYSIDSRTGFVGGVDFGYQATDKFAVTAGLMYSQMGVKTSVSGLTEYENKLKLDYINIPILANLYLCKGFAIKAGIQPGFCVNKKLGSTDMKDAVNGFDVAIPMGISYEYEGFIADLRYNLGLTDVFKDEVKALYGDSHKNYAITLTFGYKFEL